MRTILLIETLLRSSLAFGWCRNLICDGFSAACGPWSRTFFVSFWALGVLVGLNLFLSTIIGAFTSEYEELDEKTHFELPDSTCRFRLADFNLTAASLSAFEDLKAFQPVPMHSPRQP